MRFLLLPGLIVAIFAVQSSEAGEDDVREAAGRVRQIIAHRGSSVDRPECTLASCRRAIETGATAIEVDVRTTKDGHLVILHDSTLDRTTDGGGPVGEKTLAELKQLDAGSWFDAKYKGERIPTLGEVLKLCKGKIGVLLDLKEQGAEYDEKVVAEVKTYGDEAGTIVGVRSVPQAKRFRELLPKSTQLGLIPDRKSIEAFAEAGAETIRLWPNWLVDRTLVERVRKTGKQLHLAAATGKKDEVVPLLAYRPESMSSDDPAMLVKTLKSLSTGK